jgi:hypothetical protein
MNKYQEFIWDKIGIRGIIAKLAEEATAMSYFAQKLLKQIDDNGGKLPYDKENLNNIYFFRNKLLLCFYVLMKLKCEETHPAYKWIKRWAESLNGGEM